jgi:hypothetical protein
MVSLKLFCYGICFTGNSIGTISTHIALYFSLYKIRSELFVELLLVFNIFTLFSSPAIYKNFLLETVSMKIFTNVPISVGF